MLIEKTNRIISLAIFLLLIGGATIASGKDNQNNIHPGTSFFGHAFHTLTVLHDSVPEPSYLDMGAVGNSVGDVRIWHFPGRTENGESVVMEYIMTTTRIDDSAGIESRVTLGVFSFTEDYIDQVLIQGVGLYPSTESTFKPNSSLTRAIIGGTGKFRGARGEVISTHLVDGTWQHVFRFSFSQNF